MTLEEIRKEWIAECTAATEKAEKRYKELKNKPEMPPYAAQAWFNNNIPFSAQLIGINITADELRKYVILAFEAGYNHK